MIIKSNFRDYYDSVQKTDQDRELIYLRYGLPSTSQTNDALYTDHLPSEHETSISGYSWEGKPLNSLKINGRNWYLGNYFVVGVAGKFYPCAIYNGPSELGVLKGDRYKYPKFFAWSCPSKTRDMHWWNYEPCQEFYNHSPPVKLKAVFNEFHTPILVLDQNEDRAWYLSINRALSPFNFQTQMDPYTIYQEIRIFLGNMAHPEPHMIKISDRDRLQKKGFDPRTSFRHPVK